MYFFKAQGFEIGDSLLEVDKIELAKSILEKSNGKIFLPIDCVIADGFSNEANKQITDANKILKSWRMLDIGPASEKNSPKLF